MDHWAVQMRRKMVFINMEVLSMSKYVDDMFTIIEHIGDSVRWDQNLGKLKWRNEDEEEDVGENNRADQITMETRKDSRFY